MFDNVFGNKPPQKGGPLTWEPVRRSPFGQNRPQDRIPTFSKIFRWRLPDGQMNAPASVEIVGSFTQWQKIPLTRDGVLDAWHVTLHNIPAHKMHHYMMLVDGKPVQDKNCDGLAIPHGAQEEQYALMTDKGLRVLMLFAQTK